MGSTGQFLLALSAYVVAGCADAHAVRSVGQHREAIIYGSDDRLDLYAEADPKWNTRARGAAVALIEKRYLSIFPGAVTLEDRSLQERFVLCDGQRFAAQPSLANCSATLIDEDLVITAGHCFTSTSDLQCERYHYVFDYVAQSGGKTEKLTPDDVYACKRILARSVTTLTPANDLDYAVIQLDRPVSRDRTPLSISTRAPGPDETLTVMSFPSGLPLKLDHGGRVREVESSAALFSLDSDTFGASSGAGVFGEDGALLGTIVSGGADYRYIEDAGCQITRTVDSGVAQAPYEQALRSRYIVDALCAAGWPNLTLCGRAPTCGDGFCSAGERDACVPDCGAPVCDSGCSDAGADAALPEASADAAPPASMTDASSEPDHPSKSGGCSPLHAAASVGGQSLLFLTAIGIASFKARRKRVWTR